MKNTEVQVSHPHNVATVQAETLIAQAIDKGVDVGTMERLLAMRKELKAERARELFFEAMARFQAECPVIKKDKEVKDNYGKILYAYAPIDSVVSQVKDVIQRHGFSYSTKMEVLPDGVKVVCVVTHEAGHQEESPMQVPLGTKTGIMSASQQTAAATTFAKRYAFMNAFGILSGDTDNDGADIVKSDFAPRPVVAATVVTNSHPVPKTPPSPVLKATGPIELPSETTMKRKIMELCNLLDPTCDMASDKKKAYEDVVKQFTGFALTPEWFEKIITSLEKAVRAEQKKQAATTDQTLQEFEAKVEKNEKFDEEGKLLNKVH